MASNLPLLVQMALPTGRCGRRGLLLAAALLVVVQFVFSVLVAAGLIAFYGAGALVFKLATLWIALAMVVKRLHDVGLSGWWLLAGASGLAAWTVAVSMVSYASFGLDAFMPGTALYWISFLIVMVPAIGIAMWLHAAPGDHRDNRYGPLPDGFGLSMPKLDMRMRSVDAADTATSPPGQ